MFSVIKSEQQKRIEVGKMVKTIPNLWFRGKNSEKFYMCPFQLSKESFENAARNQFVPNSNWHKIPCQILESKFSKSTSSSSTLYLCK